MNHPIYKPSQYAERWDLAWALLCLTIPALTVLAAFGLERLVHGA